VLCCLSVSPVFLKADGIGGRAGSDRFGAVVARNFAACASRYCCVFVFVFGGEGAEALSLCEGGFVGGNARGSRGAIALLLGEAGLVGGSGAFDGFQFGVFSEKTG
jgi:hypothetical protein